MGLTQAILLDLARVGSQEGVDVAFLKKALEGVDLEVFVGGGIRDIDDLLNLKELGVFGVLLATALHSGKIKVEDINHAGLSLS
jgi:phosphoribosylformimino-5-aminoimidazole carboxamide ribotide isomerase